MYTLADTGRCSVRAASNRNIINLVLHKHDFAAKLSLWRLLNYLLHLQ